MKTKFSRRILAFVLAIALVVPMLVFNASAEGTTVTFTMGENVSTTTHKDGSSNSTYTETVDGYTLKITDGTNMYTGANDAKGNGCIKFGTGSKVGSCTITVPDEVTSVTLYFGKYKSNTSKVTVNGTTYTLEGASNDGAYDAITVDTSATKTISVTTVSGGYRAMLNTVEFTIPASDEPSILINGDDVVTVGNTITLTTELTNIEGTVEWSSTDDEIAEVENGVVTGVAMGHATITAAIGDTTKTKDITVYPANAEPITFAEANEIASFVGTASSDVKYTVIGTVDSIDTDYDESFNNITVTISDETGSSLQCFRLSGGETLQVGQKIKVTGAITTYNSAAQFGQGATYELVIDESTEAIIDALNALETKMSLAFKYNSAITNIVLPSTVTDTLNRDTTGATSNSYIDWSGKKLSSEAVYKGQSAGSNSSIQLRSSNSNSGIVTTTSGGKVKTITVTWNSSTTSGRTLQVYGKNTAYSAATELYDSGTQGTLLGEIVYGTSTTLTISGDYEYIGLRSASGAMYLTDISIEWEPDGAGETVQKTVCSDSQFAFRFGVNAGIADIEGVTDYGLKVTAGDTEALYTPDTVKVWGNDGEMCYVTVNLGDIINNVTRLTTDFTVQAYVEVDGIKYYCENTTTYSVLDIIVYYVDTLEMEDVNIIHLYDFLSNEYGLI
ncbi:MAG: Ig-like domain-containing protein [Clostridia bacterium]|nr:Ig-like domain-containing protein [Clostridia bacterium]